MLGPIGRYFAAAPHQPRLPDDEVKRLYPRFRLRILEATFFGYATFYVVRNNLSVVAKDMEHALHYDKSDVGSILAITAITYGLGKFVMGAVSDRSDPRKLMAFGLLLTALCNFAFGSVQNFHLHLALWAINGFVQGMGWPPCGRSMGHWFSERERGLTFSIWNTSHNLGGGVAGILAAFAAQHFGGWQAAFWFPGVLAALGAVYLFWRLRDTPQSVGLPPIEEYKNDYPETGAPDADRERELPLKELLFKYVLSNKFVWLLAFANFFAYIARYAMLDWGPTYLREMKGASGMGGGWAVLAIEFGGIPSTILLGWLSDRLGGRRGMVAVLCMIPIFLAYAVMSFTPAGFFWLDITMLIVIGFFIYPVINFIVIMALDLTSKKAIGTAAGFIGLFGYIGRTVQAKGIGSLQQYLDSHYGQAAAWNGVIYAVLGSTLIAIALLAFTWKMKPK
ncbi:MAG: MFS transporter [Myxococcota bacterium]|jgi:OPA family glycerol-3-phosphate transporter-like MFS transporter|nr:MFS transporter [Myxococcota bacterium]